MRLTGTWHGEYVYGDGYGDLAGARVPFALSLTESGAAALVGFGRITGYVRDDASKGGMPERGRIAGRRRRQRVRFVKAMPNHYLAQGDGTLVGLRDVVRAQHGLELPASLPPHRIAYEGELDQTGESMRGTWTILPWTAAAGGGVVHGAGGTGTWSAQRRSPLPSEV